MEKKEIKVSLEDFPEELHDIFRNAKLYDSSCGTAARVLYSDRGYYVKIAEKGKLEREAALTAIFEQRGIGVNLALYLSKEKDYMVTKSAEGEDALSYLGHPEKLCEALAGAMKYLHSLPVTDLPVSPCMELYAALEEQKLKQDTFIHGDFCLPNVIFHHGEFQVFIDVGLAGAGDRHIDLYWAAWSLQHNLKTDKYTDYFFDLYGREYMDFDILKLVSKMEK